MRYLLLLIATLFLLSCDAWFGPSYPPGTCIRENNKHYAGGFKESENFYRVSRQFTSFMLVSLYKDKKWFPLGKKPNKYFADGDTFEYKVVTCPDKVREDTVRMDKVRFDFKGKNIGKPVDEVK